jgi:Domain of unknown function (DUF4268)
MYSKQEASAIKRKFWTTLGQYMKPVPSAWHEKVNWLNYKTGIKDVFFRLHADNKTARISIELNHGDALIRQIFFDHFIAMKGLLHAALQEEWQWIPEAIDEWGKPVSLIQKEMPGINLMDEKSWPALIGFFKPRLIALDSFWGDVKDSMEGW